MNLHLTTGLLVVAVTVSAVLADVLDMDYSTCLTLDPFDAALPQTSPFPYALNVSKTGTMHNQDSVILTIRSLDPRVEFERFLVQARDKEQGIPVGQFVDTGDADIRVFNCFLRPEASQLLRTALEVHTHRGGHYSITLVVKDEREEFTTNEDIFAQNTAVEFDDEPKREARMRWMPDNDYNGTIRFIATVIQTKEIYWLRQLASELEVYNPW